MTMPYRVSSQHVTYVFGPQIRPVLEVPPQAVIVCETLDAASGRIRTQEDALTLSYPPEQGNPATGPIAVRGAQPGQTLAVRIVAIDLGPCGCGRVKRGGIIFDELHPPAAVLTPVHDQTVAFKGLTFPARPMLGVIGTAPAGEAVPTFYPGPHGGNLDINEIRPGATVYLPVSVPGALLALGDVHASMGDGELNGGGLDIAAEVTIEVDVRPGLPCRRPLIETDDAWSVCANGPTLPEALRMATREMTTLLATRLDLSREEAFILIGAAGDARIGQAAQLPGLDATAYLQISKTILPSVFDGTAAPGRQR